MNTATVPANDSPCAHCGVIVSKGFCWTPECIRKNAGAETFEQAFEAKLAQWVVQLEGLMETSRIRSIKPETLAQYPELNKHCIELQRGPKYVRVVRRDVRDGKPVETSGSAHCFIERATGHVLKPDGWKGPAKGIRGNIFAPEPITASVNEHGANYLARR